MFAIAPYLKRPKSTIQRLQTVCETSTTPRIWDADCVQRELRRGSKPADEQKLRTDEALIEYEGKQIARPERHRTGHGCMKHNVHASSLPHYFCPFSSCFRHPAPHHPARFRFLGLGGASCDCSCSVSEAGPCPPNSLLFALISYMPTISTPLFSANAWPPGAALCTEPLATSRQEHCGTTACQHIV